MRELFVDRTLRRFFIACAQSQLGTGAAFVALVLIAYARLHSPWAVTLVLLADFLPGIVLAPLFGALADRWPRKRLAISGDIVRAIAFIAIALVPSFSATVAFALLAGVGTSIAGPAVNSALPNIVTPEQRSPATALYGSLSSIGITVGPGLAAAFLLITSPAIILGVNGITFIVSAFILASISLGKVKADEEELSWEVAVSEDGLGYTLVESEDDVAKPSIWEDIKEGVTTATQIPGVSVFLLINAGTILGACMINVAEPIIALGPLHGGQSGYSFLVSAYGAGMVAAAFINARLGSEIMTLRRRWLLGIALDGTATILTALAPDLEVAMLTFALTGLGNILLVGPEMRLFQELVSERFLGRVYSLRDVLNNIAFVAAFLIAGVLLTILGSRDIFVIAGALTLCFAVVAVKYFHPAEQAQVRAEEDFNTTLLIAPLDFRRRDPRYQPRHHHW